MSIIPDQRLNLLRRMEELASDADWRSIGGFKTSDQEFAFRVREVLLDVLYFIDNHEQDMLERERDAERSVNKMETELEDAFDKLSEIQAYIQERKQLQVIETIIKKD